MRFSVILPALAAIAVSAASLLSGPAAAQTRGDLYTVSDIHVDVTAKSSTEAFTTAIAEGRPRAFQTLYRRLTAQRDWGRQPNLDQAALLRLSRGYNVANERRSTTRYVADVTYLFNPDAVNRLLRSSNIAFTQGNAQRILVIPMAPNVSGGGWAQALGSPSVQQGNLVPFSLPSADDLRAMANLSFDGAGWNDVAAAAGRARVTEVALVQAIPSPGKVTVNVRRLAMGQTSPRTSVDVATPQVATAYANAAGAAADAIDDLWKTRTTVDPAQRGRLTADMRITSLSQWSEAQTALAAVSQVTGVTLVAMDTGYVRMQINYMGTPDQLREALGAARLSLTSRGGQWLLASAS
jgi:hypothetical protein